MKKITKKQPMTPGIILGILILFSSGICSLYFKDSYIIPIVDIALALALFVYFIISKKKHSKDLEEYIKLVSTQNGTMANDAISRFPLATAILGVDGRILWYNNLLSKMFDDKDLYEMSISTIMPDLKWSEILKSSDEIKMTATHNQRHYDVMGNIIMSKTEVDEKGQPIYSVLLYFLDTTETIKLKSKYEKERTDVAIINIDNFDDIFQKMDDEIYQNTISSVSKAINMWVSQSNGVIKKTERDRFIMFFEHRYLKNYIKTKFELLDKVRQIGEEIKIPLSVSVGIGIDGHLIDNESYARAALDMALGRGGDQVAIKDSNQYTFYGGNTKDYEKSTRVKTRAFAVALKDYISKADKVIFMGHENSDYDSFGAAIGLSHAAKLQNKKAYIVFDNSRAIKLLAEDMASNPLYEGVLISNSHALETITPETLLVVLDTHRPSMVACPELLDKANKVVLIDHHRRSTEFIENISLTYHEAYASSTCEMATEILQYIDNSRSMSTFEAMALYVGILMDTKNFTTKTGVRTFEAASYLKRYGLDTAKVKRLFNVNKDEYMLRLEILKTTQLYNDCYAIAYADFNHPNSRVISSQAADEMLNISGIKAAFVIYPTDNEISISARSLGDVNVQVIMEELGGGGHMTVAGVQIKDFNRDEILESLKKAIDKYNDKK